MLLLKGMRMLAARGYDSQLLWAREIRDLLDIECGIQFSCTTRTFSRALAAVIARTPLLILVGRRYRVRWGELLLVDSELVREIAARTPSPASTASTASTATEAPPPAAHEPATDPPSRPSPAPGEPVESKPAADTNGPETEAADPPIGAEEDFLEHDDEALPAWLTAARFQRRDRAWAQVLRSRVPVAESASQFKGRKKSWDPP